MANPTDIFIYDVVQGKEIHMSMEKFTHSVVNDPDALITYNMGKENPNSVLVIHHHIEGKSRTVVLHGVKRQAFETEWMLHEQRRGEQPD